MSTETLGGVSSAYTLNNTTDQSYTLGQDRSVAASKEGFGAAVATGTLDALNTNPSGDMNQAYEFNKTVLGGHADAIGAVADIKI